MNIRRFLLLPLVMALGACSILPKPSVHGSSLYELAPKVAAIGHPTSVSSKVLRVNSVQAAEPYATDALIYSEHRLAVASFAYHRWVAPPPRMLTRALVASLSSANLYSEVLGPTDPGHAQEILAVDITRGPVQVFHAETKKHGAFQASSEHMAIKAVLTDADSGQVLATKVFSASESAKPNPYGGVIAANSIAGSLIRDVEKWLEKENQNKQRELQRSHH